MMNDHKHMSAEMLDRIEASAAEKAPHLIPILKAIRHHDVGFLVLQQRATRLDRGLDLLQRPFIVLIGDDTDTALGPNQYDRAAMERLLGMVDGIAIVASAPPDEAYSSLAMLAAHLHSNGLIIETRPEQEIAWTHFLQGIRPDVPILLCTVKAPRQ